MLCNKQSIPQGLRARVYVPHHRSPRDSEGGFPSHRVEAPPPPWTPQCPHRLPVPSREGKRENHTSVQKEDAVCSCFLASTGHKALANCQGLEY